MILPQRPMTGSLLSGLFLANWNINRCGMHFQCYHKKEHVQAFIYIYKEISVSVLSEKCSSRITVKRAEIRLYLMAILRGSMRSTHQSISLLG